VPAVVFANGGVFFLTIAPAQTDTGISDEETFAVRVSHR